MVKLLLPSPGLLRGLERRLLSQPSREEGFCAQPAYACSTLRGSLLFIKNANIHFPMNCIIYLEVLVIFFQTLAQYSTPDFISWPAQSGETDLYSLSASDWLLCVCPCTCTWVCVHVCNMCALCVQRPEGRTLCVLFYHPLSYSL